MRILTPAWMIPLGLATLALPGCGERDTNEVARENVMTVIDQANAARVSESGLADDARVYTIDQERQGVQIPADYSPAAFQQDRLNALISELEAASVPAGPLQQYSIARTLADIHRSEATYLAGRAQESFAATRDDLIRGQSFAQRLQRVNARLAEINGDRSAVVSTFQTGELGGDYPNVQGVEQLRERAAAMQQQIESAQQRYESLAAEVQKLEESRREHDALELELQNEASSLSGEARYDKLEQSIRAWQQARIDEAMAEEKILRAKAEFYSAGLALADLADENGRLSPELVAAFNRMVNEQQVAEIVAAFESQPDLASVTAAIDVLNRRIQEVQAEIRSADDARRAATAVQADAVDEFNAMLALVTDKIDVLVTDRYQTALDKMVAAEEKLTAATPPGTLSTAHDIDLLAAYLQHVRIQHDQLTALDTYQSLFDTLAANGQSVLGESLVATLEGLSAELDEPIEALRAEASMRGENESLRQTVTAHLETLRAAVGEETAEAVQVEALSEALDTLWQNMAGGDAADAPDAVEAPDVPDDAQAEEADPE